MEISFEQRRELGFQYVLDLLAPCSPYGAELVRKPRFFAPREREALEAEWANVQAAIDGLSRFGAQYSRLRLLFMQVRDIRQTLRRCRETVLTEVELFEVKRFLLQLSLIAPLFAQICEGYGGIRFTEETDALRLLDPEGQRTAGFSISSAYSKALGVLREEKSRLEARLRTADAAEREDLLNARRSLLAREEAETLRVRARLSEALRPHLDALEENARMIGALDFVLEKASLARDRRAVRPRVSEGGAVFSDMVNPQLSDALQSRGASFTPVSLEAAVGTTVITGANMGGKSVALKTLALNLLLCQAGFFAFASRAETPLFDAFHILSGDLSDARGGLSSFGSEVVRIQQALSAVEAGEFLFVALDEPGRGTNPREGAALVRSLTRHLARAHAVTVVATHFGSVAACAAAHYQAAGLKLPPDAPPAEDRLAFIARHMNYGLVRVPADAPCPQEALTICRLLGLDARVTEAMRADLEAHREGEIS